MTCANRTANSVKATTGVSRKPSVTNRGCLRITRSSREALERSRQSSAQRTPLSFSGSAGTKSSAGPFQRRARSSTGVRSDLIIRCGISAGNSTHIGLEASRPSGKSSTPAGHGRMRAPACGSATGPHAVGAVCIVQSAPTCRSTSTISSALPTSPCELISIISSCSVRHVISSFTRGGM